VDFLFLFVVGHLGGNGMGRYLSPFVHERIAQLLKDGLPGGVICKRLGISRVQLKREAEKQGLRIKKDLWGLSLVYDKLQGR